MQPCWNINKSPANTKNVNFKTKLFVKVKDATNNIINFGNPIVDIRSCTGNSITENSIILGKEYSLDQPGAYSYYLIQAFIETLECGWPIPTANYSANSGGMVEYEKTSPILPVPSNYIFQKENFTVILKTPC